MESRIPERDDLILVQDPLAPLYSGWRLADWRMLYVASVHRPVEQLSHHSMRVPGGRSLVVQGIDDCGYFVTLDLGQRPTLELGRDVQTELTAAVLPRVWPFNLEIALGEGFNIGLESKLDR